MVEPIHLSDIMWALATVLELVLLIQLIRKRLLKVYPIFSSYLFSAILQSAALALIHRMTAFTPETVWNLAWGTQAVVVLLRAQAIVELIRKILSMYSGIWALARRLLLTGCVIVIAYSLLFSKGQWQWVIMNGVRGLELAMAAVIVTVLLFARYYRLPIDPLPRGMAVGFCLYSAFYVIDYSLLEKSIQQYSDFWNFLGMLTFLASLILWINTVSRYSQAVTSVIPTAIRGELYGKLSSEVNLRLHLLNQELSQLLRSQDHQR
ncbi:MAG: hypothetical protein WAK29_13665 [Terriglobales bacterium]|jgi:hypothetical protein